MPKIIHRMLRVLNLEKSLKLYADCFGLTPLERLDIPGLFLTSSYNAKWDVEVNMTQAKGNIELCTEGNDCGHARLCMPDAAAGQAGLASPVDGPLDTRKFKTGTGRLMARCLFIQGPNTYQMEALERHGHYP